VCLLCEYLCQFVNQFFLFLSCEMSHAEFSAADREAAAEFYSDVFGWETEQYPDMNYALFSTGEGVGGGFNPVSEDNPAGSVLVHIGADDIPTTLAQIEQHGGATLVPETEIPGVGWFGIFKDPTGNVVALYKDKGE